MNGKLTYVKVGTFSEFEEQSRNIIDLQYSFGVKENMVSAIWLLKKTISALFGLDTKCWNK